MIVLVLFERLINVVFVFFYLLLYKSVYVYIKNIRIKNIIFGFINNFLFLFFI